MDRRCKDLRELTVQKEQELQSLREHHANQLEEALKDARSEIAAERKKFRDLRNDFEYNLSLLERRDEELGRYDTAYAELRQTVQNLVAENSELKIEIDRLVQEASTHKEKEQQLKNYYLQRIEEQRHQLDAYRQVKDREVAGDRAECARLQKELQARLVEVRGEVGVERERMEAQYDCLLRRQEGELRARVAELTTSLVEKEGLLRELGKELQAAKTAAECVRREAEEKAEEAAKMEQGHRTKERELLEQLSAQGLKVVDLETLLASSESRLKGLQGEAARKLAELDRSLREKDRALTATKEAYRLLECDMEKAQDAFKRQLEEVVETCRNEQQVHRTTLEEKREEAGRLEKQLLKDKKAAEMKEVELVKEGVVKDAQVRALQETVARLQSQLHSRDADVERFKQELMVGAEREATLLQGKAQAELDWARKLEEVERSAYSRHEDIITQLSKSRDKAIAECKQQEVEMGRMAEALKSLQLGQRGASLAVGQVPRDNQRSGVGGGRGGVSDLEQRYAELEQRNQELKAVIQEMRKEMEQCCVGGQGAPLGGSRMGDAPYSAEYVGYLEREMAEMKVEKRKMAEHLEELGARKKPPTPPPPPPPQSPARIPSSDVRHRAHLIALSDTIATLQREKCALEVEVMQLKGREEQLQDAIRLCQEEVHRSKALSVPPSKAHHKLLRATQVIIALVKEKESLLREGQWLKAELQELHQQLAQIRPGEGPPVYKYSPPPAGAPPITTPPDVPPTAMPLPQSRPPQQPATAAPPTAIPSTHSETPPTGAPPTMGPPPLHQQPVPHLHLPLPPPTHHSSPLPPSVLNESSDFDQQHDNLERLLCHLGNEDSHAQISSSRQSSPSHPVVSHEPPPPLEEVEGREGMSVQGLAVRPLAKNTNNTARAPVKLLHSRRLGHNKPVVRIRNYNNRS